MMAYLFRIGLAVFFCALSVHGQTAEKSQHPYELMICDYVKFQLYKMDKAGEITWKHQPESKVWDFVLTKENHIVFPIITKHFEVRCMDFEKKIQWSWSYRKDYREIINITQSKSGLIISGQKPSDAIVMDVSGKILRKIDIPTNFNSQHGEMGNVYALKDDHYLVQLWGEGSVIEVDKDGKEVWRYKVPKFGKGRYPVGCVQDVLRLKNGNTMIACGTQARILEVDKNKKIAWQFNKDDHPELNFTNACGLQLLKDGSILVTNFIRGKTGKGAHAFILSKDRKITWTLTDHKHISAASRVFAIEK
jgi:hypothetical protein